MDRDPADIEDFLERVAGTLSCPGGAHPQRAADPTLAETARRRSTFRPDPASRSSTGGRLAARVGLAAVSNDR